MKKIEKISVLISIVLISLIAIGAVSAADDTASADDADTVAASEVQTIESDQTIDDISYESTDIIVTDTGDSGDDDVAVVDNSSKKSNSLGSPQLAEGNTKTFTDLQTDLAGSTAILSSDYAYVAADGDTLKNGVVIDHDLTIIGGGHTISGSDLARIFYVNSGKTLTLMGLTLVNGAAENGAAIYNDGGSITIASSNINDNTATKSGGGIYNNGGSLTITSSEINGNDLTDRTVNGYGGAAIYDNGGTVLISGSTIANNLKDIVHRGGTGAYTGDLSSAAISTKNGKLTVTESVLENNSGSYGGAILADGANAELLVSGCTFNKNFAFNGGAIDISSGASYTITDSKFYNNDAKGTGSTNSNYANGGAICAADEDNQGIITGCEFENNTAAIGGAISSENTIVTECNFTNNTASASNSENFNGKVNNRGGFAGAIFNDGTINIDDSNFNDNAGRGEGIRVKDAQITDSSFKNSTICGNLKGTLELTNNTYDNTAKDVQPASTSTVIINVGEGNVPAVQQGTVIVNGDMTFQDLQDFIDANNTKITLNGNVVKADNEIDLFANGITITAPSSFTIYGNGNSIIASTGKIFNVPVGKTLTLRNATLEGSRETAITNYGSVSLYYNDTNQFINCGDVLIDNNGAINTNTISTFTELSYFVSLVNGGEIYLGSSAKITKTEEEKAYFANGIVIDKDLSIRGYYSTRINDYISADNSGRIFTVNEGKTLSLKGINVTNGNDADGGAVYLSNGATLNANTVNFLENTATYSGGAIYAAGATVNLNNCTLDSNMVTDFTANNDTGGAAIHAEGSTVTIANSKVTNNGDKTLNRTKGDLINGAINLIDSDLTVSDSVFENNTGIYGGAITIQAPSGEKSLSITGSNFTNNNAYDGAAIHIEKNIKYDIKDTLFDENNKAAGEGSPGYCAGGGALFIKGSEGTLDNITVKGSQATQGGAIDIENSKATITNSVFENNQVSESGGAIFAIGTSELTVSTSTFEGNDAGAWAGAICADGNTALTVTDSTFKDNTAAAATIVTFGTSSANINANFTNNTDTYNWGVVTVYGTGDVTIEDSNFTKDVEGSKISDVDVEADAKVTIKDCKSTTNSNYAIWATAGDLILENNEINAAIPYPIFIGGDAEIKSDVKANVSANETYNAHLGEITVTVVLTDDTGENLIKDANFNFVVYKDGEKVFDETATFDGEKYIGTFTPTTPGSYVVTLDYAVEEVATATYNVVSSLTDLKNLIDANTNGTLDLDFDFAYIADYDSAIVNGIEINKAITINGNNHIINGSDLSRLFNVVAPGDLTLNGVTIANGKADYGAGIYVADGAKLTATGSTFTENVATYKGGAIYSEGTVDVSNSVISDNNITHRSGPASADYGGAAIYNKNGVLTLDKVNVTNNLKDIVIRQGNSGDLIDAVVVTTGDATISNSYFANNTGCYGGAIYVCNDATLTVTGTTFEGNNATFGGAIDAEGAKLIVDDCTFTENKGLGVGSPGTSNTQGGAIVVFPGTSSAKITGSTFTKNTANVGGAVSFAGVGIDSSVENCVFTENTGVNEGGAIYLRTSGDAEVTVEGSTFTDNDAPFGSAISSEGTLSLSGNTMTGGSVVPIGSYDGIIVSEVNVIILNGETVTTSTATNDITAILTDDNGNPIIDNTLVLIVNDEEVETDYNKVTGVMTGSYTFTAPGSYEVTAKDIDAAYTTSGTMVYIGGTFTELQNLINDAEAGATITLTHDIIYNAIDGDALKDGILVNKIITIVGGEGIEICGSDVARVFNVVNGLLTLKNLTICDGLASEGAGVHVDSTSLLVADNVTFTENVAVYRGGAIYSEGSVAVSNSVIDSNDITFRTKNDDNGGAAIYNMKGSLVISKTNITNNLKDIVIRDGNNGDLLDGVVITSGTTIVSGSYFANNTGSWGGAISSLGYLNDEAYTTSIYGTTFEGNNATFGGAIFVESSELLVDGCTFNNNKGLGVGSSGTSNTQGGAIVVFPNSAKATITDSTFTANSANTGGAVSLPGVDQDCLIEGCTFTDNTASDGGAVYLWTGGDAAVTVKDSTFTGNTAGWGNAISTDGALKLEGNTITGTGADIGNWAGTIESKVISTILENKTYDWHAAEILINATLTDDMGNIINDHNFNFVITFTALRGTIEVPAVFKPELGYYQASFTPDKSGEYLINLDYATEEVATSVIRVQRSLTDLANLIAAAEDNDVITVDGDYAYIEEFDSAIKDGIVIDKTITVKGAEGANITICGSDLARLFYVTTGSTLNLADLTICDGAAEKGAGVYVEANALFNALNVTFHDNVAVKRGGAIYSEGLTYVKDSNIYDNNITFRTANDDNGGAAIYNMKGNLYIENTNITNNLKDIVIRNGNAGDLLDGVVITTGETVIKDSYFANNTGSWGGAISSLGYMNDQPYTLTIENTTFEGNNATFGGAIFVESSNLVVKDSRFNDNKGVGVGSSGTSNTQGGAIVVFPNGAKATITGSNFTANSANIGGAVSLAGVDQDSLIDDCIFTDNTASSEGGAVYLWTQGDADVTVEDSTFSGNTAPWGNAISNDAVLKLHNNTISGTSADIANYYGSIESEVIVEILGNDTTEGSGIIEAVYGETVDLYAVITDDNGNLINDITFAFTIVNGATTDTVTATYNAETKKYEGKYTIANAGAHLVSITSDADDYLTIRTGLIDVEKANVTLIVNVEDINVGEKAVVTGKITGINDEGIKLDLVVVVDDVNYNVTTAENGTFSFEVEGLTAGTYDAYAIFFGNDNYNYGFANDFFDVKQQLAVTLDTISLDFVYGDEVLPEFTVKDAYTGEPLTGVEITIVGFDDASITYDDEEGNYEVNLGMLKPGEYDLTAIFKVGDYEPYIYEHITVTVSKADIDVIVSRINDTITYGQNETIFVGTNNTAFEGTITVTIINYYNGTEITTFDVVLDPEDEDVQTMGGKLIDISSLDAGKYNITATFAGNDYFNAKEAIIQPPLNTFEVKKAEAVVFILVPSVKVGENIVGNIFLFDSDENPLNGTVHIEIAGTFRNVDVEDGVYSFNITNDLPAGTDYEAFVQFRGGHNYEDSDDSCKYNVIGLENEIIIEDIGEVAYGTEIEGKFHIVDEDGEPITDLDADKVSVTVDGNAVEVVIKDGVGTYTIPVPLAVGTHNVTVVFAGDNKYNASIEESTFKVVIAHAIASLNVNETAYGDNAIVGVILVTEDLKGINATVMLHIVDGDYVNDTVEVVNGTAFVEIPGLIPGHYEVVVSFFGNENYTAAYDWHPFNVTKATPVLTVDDTEVEYGTPATVTVKLVDADGNPITGEVVVTASWLVDSETVLVELPANGTGEATFTLADVGGGTTVDVVAKFYGDDTYVAVNNTAKIVIKESTDATIEVISNKPAYGEDTIITVTVKDAAGTQLPVEKVNVTFNGETEEKTVGVDGTINLGKLPVGDTEVTVSFNDGVHNEASETINVTVDPAFAKVAVDKIATEPGQTPKVLVNVTDANGQPVTGKVHVSVNGEDINPSGIELAENGTAEVEIPVSGPGNYYVDVSYADSNYEQAYNSTLIIVEKATTASVTLTVEPSSIKETETATIKVTLNDGETKLDGIVIVTVGDTDYAVNVTSGEGSVVVKNLAADTYTVKGKFIGNDNYAEATATDQTLEVTKVSEVKVDVKTEGDNIVIKLTDENGEPVNSPVNVTVDGVTQEVQVTNGTATVPIGSGDHNVSVVYAGDAAHGGTTVINNIVNGKTPVTKRIATKLTISRTKVYTYNKYIDKKKDYLVYVTLKDVNGNVLSGKKVQYASHGKVYTRTSNAKGQIKFYVAHTPSGTCYRAITFLGDDKYNGSFIGAGIKIVKQKVKLSAPKKKFKSSAKVKKLTATLKNTKGKKIGKRKIVFVVNKKKYTAKTNKKGKATVKIKLTRKGTYKVKVKFAGDKSFKKVTKTTKVTIN